MIYLKKEDLDDLKILGSGRFGVVYQKDDKLAYKIYIPSLYDEFGQVRQNPVFNTSNIKYLKLIDKSKNLRLTGGIIDTICIDGKFGGVCIPYYNGKILSHMMDEDYSLKIDISKQLVESARELSHHFIYPFDYKLNNIMYENGNVRIIDLDDNHTHVFTIPNPIFHSISVYGLAETIQTFLYEYKHLPLPKDISRQLGRFHEHMPITFHGIDKYLQHKEITRSFLSIDEKDNLGDIESLLRDENYNIIYSVDDRLDSVEYQRIINNLRLYNIPLYDFVLKDKLSSYPEIENTSEFVYSKSLYK